MAVSPPYQTLIYLILVKYMKEIYSYAKSGLILPKVVK